MEKLDSPRERTENIAFGWLACHSQCPHCPTMKPIQRGQYTTLTREPG